MLELKRVKVADIYPLEDEYGNTFLSRDYSLEANKRYVRELAASFGPSGEPDEQVKLIRDGDVYRIKAGNSRVMAMRELGTEECWAVIDSDDTVQSVLETVVRTDVKKTYEDIEKSRYIQQLAMFGDDQYVSEVSQISTEDAAKMRRGRALAADKAEQYTLDRLYAIGEFEGDEDAIGQIMDAKESSLYAVVDSLRRKREAVAAKQAFIEKAESLNITLCSSHDIAQKRYICTCEDPENLAADYMAAAVDFQGIVGSLGINWSGVYVMFYGEPLGGETEEDRLAAERRKTIDDIDMKSDAINTALLEFVGANLAKEDGGKSAMPALYGLVESKIPDMYRFDDALETFPRSIDFGANPLVFAEVFCEKCESLKVADRFIAGFSLSPYYLRMAEGSYTFIDAAMRDGMELDEDALGFVETVRTRIEAAKGDKE